MTFAPIATIPTSSSFCSLITNDELLQINSNTVSVVSSRSGFCKYFYYLPLAPRLFSINPTSPTRFAVVYPSVDGTPETIAILETYTGNVLKQFTLKNTLQKFTYVSISTYMFFVIDSSPSIVYFVQPTGNQISHYDVGGNISFLTANTKGNEFAVSIGKELIIIDTQGPNKLQSVELSDFTFLNYVDKNIIYGMANGTVNVLNLETSMTKVINTPHGSSPLNYTELYGVTKDGMIFSADSGLPVACISGPYSIQMIESTVAVFCKDKTQIYESARRSVSTVTQLQPPEPFVDSIFSVPPSLFFANASAIYTFNISLNETSKFVANSERIKKIVACDGCLSIVSISNNCDRIITFVTGTKKRDEIGIDVICDKENNTWILQKDGIFSFYKKLLSIQEKTKIELPEDHQYEKIFRIKDTIGVYSSKLGKISFIRNNKLIDFEAPKYIKIIQWPALCSEDKVYILKNDIDELETIKINDFVCIDESVTSCCWLARTLFAVDGRKVLAFNQKGQKRLIDILPNAMCTISAALPSQLIFVTTLPDLRVINLKRPFLFVTLLDISPDDTQCLKYMLSYLPPLAIEPRAITSLTPIIAMSVFNKAPPKYVTSGVVKVYSRFARFNELLDFIHKSESNKKILKETAEAARKLGQFGVAQKIYEELKDYESLFEIFMIARSLKNLEVLASKSNLLPSIEYFGISPEEGEFEPLPNLELPKICQPYLGEEFTLYAGAPNEGTPLYPPSFDELSDFGLREYPLTGEEKMLEQQAAEAINTENTESTEPPVEIEYKERPKEEEKKDDEDLQLNKLFDDDDEEPVKKIDFSINIKPKATSRQRVNRGVVKFRLSKEAEDIAPKENLPEPHVNNRTRRASVFRTRKSFEIAGLPNISDEQQQQSSSQEENLEHQFVSEGISVVEQGEQSNPEENYVSTLFMDI